MPSEMDPQADILKIIANIDRVIHSPARLMILTYLYVVESGDLVYLMRQTGLTWGNLASHVSKLEEAGYIKIEKEFVNRKPRTWLELTKAGRTAFQNYRKQLTEALGALPD
jgi:DNA-binding MarR family transcriptional regulator